MRFEFAFTAALTPTEGDAVGGTSVEEENEYNASNDAGFDTTQLPSSSYEASIDLMFDNPNNPNAGEFKSRQDDDELPNDFIAPLSPRQNFTATSNISQYDAEVQSTYYVGILGGTV